MLKQPVETDIIDISNILENKTSSLFLKREDTQITGSHKYRLIYGLITNTNFVIADGGNAALATVDIANQLGYEVKIFAYHRLSRRIRSKLHKYTNYTMYYSSAPKHDAELFCMQRKNWSYIDIYDDLHATDWFKNIIPDYITDFIAPVDTGAMLLGAAEMSSANIYACTVADKFDSIPGVRNFKSQSSGEIILSALEQNLIAKWYKHKITDIKNKQFSFSQALHININLATTLSIMAAIDLSNDVNNSSIMTVCTGKL